MENFSQFGKILLAVGGIAMLAGLTVLIAGKIPGGGRLPGDIIIRKGNVTFYFPMITCILASLILALIFYLLKKW